MKTDRRLPSADRTGRRVAQSRLRRRHTRAYTATGLVNGRTYYFRVRAANSLGWSRRGAPRCTPCPSPQRRRHRRLLGRVIRTTSDACQLPVMLIAPENWATDRHTSGVRSSWSALTSTDSTATTTASAAKAEQAAVRISDSLRPFDEFVQRQPKPARKKPTTGCLASAASQPTHATTLVSHPDGASFIGGDSPILDGRVQLQRQ